MSGHIAKVNAEKRKICEKIDNMTINPVVFFDKETGSLTEDSKMNIIEEQKYIEQRRSELNAVIGEYDSLGKNASTMLPTTKKKYMKMATDLKNKDEKLKELSAINNRLLSL